MFCKVVEVLQNFLSENVDKKFCRSGEDSLESSGILTMIDGPEHDGNSGRRRPVESSLFSFILCHVGSHVPTLSSN